jgi:hypothetical protein
MLNSPQMRKLLFIFTLFLIAGSFQASRAQCKLKELKSIYLDKIKPYEFEGISAGIIFSGESTTISVSVFRNQKYRLFFHSEGFDGPVSVKVMTRNRFVLFTNKDDPSLDRYTFVPKKSEDYFVEFTTPTSANEDARGCVAVILSSRGY